MSDQLSHPGQSAARPQAVDDTLDARTNRSRQVLVKEGKKASHQLGGFALALLGALTLSAAGEAEPFVPTSDTVVLERLPSIGDPLLREQRAALAQNPGDLDVALALASAYAALGRSEGDPRYDGYAQAALALWWNPQSHRSRSSYCARYSRSVATTSKPRWSISITCSRTHPGTLRLC
jgi:hypothetical protein